MMVRMRHRRIYLIVLQLGMEPEYFITPMARRVYSCNFQTTYDAGDCSNYKQISIIDVAYKILAHIILQRLKSGGAEQCILQNQFGFKPKARTMDAMFLARRAIDHAINYGAPSFMIAFDWSKAFDSLMPHALFRASNRCCILSDMISMIKYIYQERAVFIRDGMNESCKRSQ